MNITRANYECYFLDYLEGSLDPSMIEELNAFLDRNPDLKEELEEFEQVSLPVDSVTFREKDRLKKLVSTPDVINDQGFDYLCIAKLEGDLDPRGEKALDQLLMEHPDRKKEMDLYGKTRLQPVPVIFPDKRFLKRKVPVFRRKYTWYSIPAAASIMLILAFSLLLGRFRNPQEDRVAVILPTAENSDATLSEETTIVEEDIPSSTEHYAEQMVYDEQHEDVEEDDAIAITLSEATEQAGITISGDSPEIVADRTSDLGLLTRREFEHTHTSPEITLAIPKIIERENEVEGEYLTLRELVARRLRNIVSAEEPDATGSEDKITFLDVADAGVRGISLIPGVDMKLERYYDQNGELTSYAFSSKPLSFSHEVKKKTGL